VKFLNNFSGQLRRYGRSTAHGDGCYDYDCSTVLFNDVLRLVPVQGGFYSLVAQRQVPGSRSSRATCHRRPASLSAARACLGAECAVLYRVCASCRSAPASVATGTVILGLRAQQFSGSFIAAPAAPRRSLLYYRSEVECTTPFHHVYCRLSARTVLPLLIYRTRPVMVVNC